MNRQWISPFWLILVLFPGLVSGQLLISTVHYNINDGLPSEDLYCGLQDHKGYLWFGSDAGVIRYNGFEFVRYTSKDGLNDNTIFTLHEDAEGRIWMTGFSRTIGFLYDNRFFNLYGPDNQTPFQTREFIHRISSTPDYVYFNGTTKVYRYDKKGGQYSISALPDSSDASVLIFNENGIWCGIRTDNIYQTDKITVELRKKSGEILEQTISIQPLATNPGISRFQVYRDSLFFWSNGNLLISIDTLGHTQVLQEHHDFIQLNMLPDRLEVAIEGEGIFTFPDHDISRPPSLQLLPRSSITHILTDREEGMWLTTLEEGIVYAPAYRQKKRQLPELDDIRISFIEYINGRIWIGGKEGGMYSISDNLENPDVQADPNFQTQTRMNCILPKGNQLLVCGSGKTFICDDKQGRLIPRSDIIGGFRKMIMRPDGRIFGISRNYIYPILPNGTGPFVRITKGECFSAENYGKYLLIGTLNGVMFYDDERNRISDPYPGYQQRVDIIKKGPGNSIWLGTRNGGLQIVSSRGLTILNTENGLVENTITAIAFDTDSTAYVGTKNGISVIRHALDPSLRSIYNYNYMDGLISNEITSLCLANGYLLIGTNKGMIYMRIADLAPNPTAPHTYIESVRNLKTTRAGTEFRHNENDIEFIIGTTSFRSGEHVKLRYKIRDNDQKYYYQGGNNRILLPGLSPDYYHLQVWTANSSGKWSDHPAEYRFTIRKPLWKEIWFVVIFFSLFTVLLIIIFLLRIRTVRRKDAEKARLQLTIEELKMESLRLNMNPHFIFNSLNSIQHYILKNKTSEAYHYLETFASLIRNILEYSQQAFISLGEELETLRMYIELENLRLENSLQVEYDIDPAIDQMLVNVPPLLIQPFVENSIWHGLMPRSHDRQLKISIRSAGKVIHCIIEDNGVGRQASAGKGRIKGKKSFGVAITLKRMEGLKQRNPLYNLEVEDLLAGGQAMGTRVKITIPNG